MQCFRTGETQWAVNASKVLVAGIDRNHNDKGFLNDVGGIWIRVSHNGKGFHSDVGGI